MAAGKGRRILRAVLALTTLCVPCLPVQAQYGGGSGTADDPYQIWTAEQMNAIGAEPNDWDKHFQLMADIDLSAFDGRDGRPAFNIIALDTDADEPWSQRYAFSGVFDGNGHTIANFTHTSTDRYRYAGLFGFVGGPKGEIRNLGLVNATLDVGAGFTTGALAGTNAGAIMHCCSSGTVQGKRDCVGGLVGNNRGVVMGCHSAGTVTGAGDGVGGLVGLNDEGAVVHCYSTTAVRGTKSPTGGLVGLNWGPVMECYSTGLVRGTGQFLGGLVGVTNQSGVDAVGAVSNSFWDIGASLQFESSGGTGLMTDQMQDPETYRQAGWDWLGRAGDGTSEVWQMPAGGGYPVLTFFQGYVPARLQGTGTPDDPYLIADAEDLGAMHYCDPYAHYRLTHSIDLSGIRWATPVIPWFGGVFDGNGRTIAHLAISGDAYLGLFGTLAEGAQVKDLAVVDANVAGTGWFVGALAARNYGAIVHCYATGAVMGDWNVGGLAGSNGWCGTVTQCYSTAAVGAKRWGVGALLGENYGTVVHCYAVDTSLDAREPAGTLVGLDWGTVYGCFSETLRSAYYGGGRSRALAVTAAAGNPMQDPQTYLAAGWDWLGERANGTSEVWQMPSEGGYPVLSIFNGYTPARLSGRGTADDPYWLSDANELGAMVYYNPGAYYRLAAPIDLAGIRWSVPVISSFAGTFDGGGLSILHLTLSGGGHLGLFGRLTSPAQVRDLVVGDVNIVGTGPYVGALAGFNHSGAVTRCRGTGTVRGTQSVGGLLAHHRWGDVTDCYSEATVSGTEQVGGLLGFNAGRVVRGASGGAVNAEKYVGGLVGSNSGALEDCRNAAVVTGADTVGGLTGLNWYGRVTRGYNSGAIRGRDHVGGVVGSSTDEWSARSYQGAVTDCRNVGPISGRSAVGGLMGSNADAVTNCRSTGAVQGDAYIGGLVGSNAGTVTRSSAEGAVDGNEYVGGLAGYTGATLLACRATGRVTGGREIGGLVGSNWFATIRECCSFNVVTAEANDVGGLVGENLVGSMIDCYSTSSVTGRDYVGGVIGIDYRVSQDGSGDEDSYLRGTIQHCYFAGRVSGRAKFGGFVGAPGGIYSSYFWDRQLSGLAEMFGEPDPGAIGCDNTGGKTTAELQTAATFLNAGWDFTGETANGTADLWRIEEGKDYPRLWWEAAGE